MRGSERGSERGSAQGVESSLCSGPHRVRRRSFSRGTLQSESRRGAAVASVPQVGSSDERAAGGPLQSGS